MTGAVEQRSDVRLPPPRDIDDQNACANRNEEKMSNSRLNIMSLNHIENRFKIV